MLACFILRSRARRESNTDLDRTAIPGIADIASPRPSVLRSKVRLAVSLIFLVRLVEAETEAGLCAELGKKFGPFDLSFVPIWRGGSLGFVSYIGLRVSRLFSLILCSCNTTLNLARVAAFA